MSKQTKKLSDSIEYAELIGYSKREMESVPAKAALTHGCGNPTAIADLKEGQIVLDLGCGGGLDVFLASQKIGPKGKVIGIDISPQMIEKNTAVAKKENYPNIEFKVAPIEKLPIPDNFVDVAISNCAINHCPDKAAVFREVHRILKNRRQDVCIRFGYRREFTEQALQNVDKLWVDWLAAAWGKQDYLNAIKEAGFRTITVLAEATFPMAQANEILKENY
jgi:ubiquinone/menaquinone biosynthesis C-methylase UbiE